MALRFLHSILNGKRGELRKIELCSKISSVILLILLLSPSMGSPRSSSVGEAKFLSSLENAVVHELNMARTAPKDYSSFLEQYKKYYDKKLLRLPGQTPILTNEGVGAVVEAIRFLRSAKPLPSPEPFERYVLGSKGSCDGSRTVRFHPTQGERWQPAPG